MLDLISPILHAHPWEAVKAAAMEDGWNVDVVCQPPQSPDLNVLDLGLFASLQSLQYKLHPKTISELCQGVFQAHAAMKMESIDNIFLARSQPRRPVFGPPIT